MKKLGHLRDHVVTGESGQGKDVEKDQEILAFHVGPPDSRYKGS
jgi:hypothetical protein